uniref:Nuclear receptor domain-containing protein n=1 Tax=Steinernema glaseri TaxID=37863 RepID=A0A1I7ZD25_9BILA
MAALIPLLQNELAAWNKMNANTPGSSSQVEELCLVCNDISTGYHYGVPSCNGCKTFFRRTIMKKQTFVCQYEGKCPVDKSIRCACRHCRFEKCLSVGMDRNAIQQNRDPIGYTKRTRRYPPVKNVASVPKTDLSLASSIAVDQGSPTQSVVEMTPEQLAEDHLLQALKETEEKLAVVRCSHLEMGKSLIDYILKPCAFSDDAFMKKHATPIHNMNNMRRVEPADYQYWHEQDWILMIEWAKTIPFYELLPLPDKLALLRHSSITYPSLLQCFYSPDKGPDTIVFPNGAYFDRAPEPHRPAGFQRKKYQMLDQLLRPMRKMEIDSYEFAAAKAIFFLNPDADDVSMDVKMSISEGRSAITNALYRYMVKRRGVEEAADRFGRLLLLGTVIATMAVEMKETVVVADFFGQIRFSQFAKELLFGIKEEVPDVGSPTVITS